VPAFFHAEPPRRSSRTPAAQARRASVEVGAGPSSPAAALFGIHAGVREHYGTHLR
jgi:hypothetical protein